MLVFFLEIKETLLHHVEQWYICHQEAVIHIVCIRGHCVLKTTQSLISKHCKEPNFCAKILNNDHSCKIGGKIQMRLFGVF